MRTTLTVEADIAHQIQNLVAASRKPFKTVVNDLLRRGLAAKGPLARKPFTQETVALGWNESIDPTGFNRLADALATEADAMVIDRFEASLRK